MRYKAEFMKDTIQIATPERWAAIYAYSGSWDRRWNENPWCWFAQNGDDSFPHFTAYANDFARDSTLLKFHITFNYRGERYKPVHVHYRFNCSQSQTQSRNIDANRAGYDKKPAVQYVHQHRAEFNRLAQAFVLNAFAMPGLPTTQQLASAKAGLNTVQAPRLAPPPAALQGVPGLDLSFIE